MNSENGCTGCVEFHIQGKKCNCYCHRERKIEGMGNTVPTYTNATGGKQSDIPYRFDLLPPLSLFKIAEILKKGAEKYGENNWHKIPVNENLNHALAHIISYLAGDRQEDHIRNAACRILFASEVDLMNPKEYYVIPGVLSKEEIDKLNKPGQIVKEAEVGQTACKICCFVRSAHIKDTLMDRLYCPVDYEGSEFRPIFQ